VTELENGWRARLWCNFEKGPRKTIVRRGHVGPLSIQRPFYPEGSTAHVYLLHPPGGVVGGDRLTVDVVSDAGASGLLTTPGAAKFYRSADDLAYVQQKLHCKGDLEWFPQENIFFDGSRVVLNTHVDLELESSFSFWEINCFGRLAGDLPFREGSVVSKLTVERQGDPVFYDRFCFDGSDTLTRVTGMRGLCVCGMLILSPVTKEMTEVSAALLERDSAFSVTYLDGLMVARYLGNSAEQAKDGFIKLWSLNRLAVSQREVCMPRIWAT